MGPRTWACFMNPMPRSTTAGVDVGGGVIRVVIGSDSWQYARTLESALTADPGIALVGHAFIEADVVQLATTARPDIAVLHVDRKELGMLTAWQRLAAEDHAPLVVAVAFHDDEELGRVALAAGSSSYIVMRDSEPGSRLVRAVHTVAAGSLLLDGALRSLVVDLAAAAPSPAARAGLTPRELEMLPLLAEGQRNKEIALQLGVGDQTVRNHLSRMYRKLGAGNRTQMIAEARRRGILD